MRLININNRIFVNLNVNKWRIKDINVVRKVIRACSIKKQGLSVKLSNDDDIKELNYHWRGIKKPTNILSFPNLSKEKSFEYLGDIIISFQTLKKETKINKVPFESHLSHILVHGILHLKGYNHDHWEDENIMKKEEIRILDMLKMNTTYLKRTL